MRRYIATQSEALTQQHVCDYLRLRYPNVIFRSDYASGLKLTMGQAVQHKRLQSSRAWPDLFIAHPKDECHGFFIEMKRPDAAVFKRDGSLVADPHIREQAAMLDRLRERGYKAEFAIGFDQARALIDEYLENETEPLLTEF